MPSLSQMKSLDHLEEPILPLGPAEKHSLPTLPLKEQRSPTNPQVIIKPDGKMETAIPENIKARMPKVGDLVRVLSGQPWINEINAMIGKVYPIEELKNGSIVLSGGWHFGLLGEDMNGWLATEFADEAPKE